ncbi:Anthocyanidin 3-O-glucoside 2''-O-glucosyltransferase [Camellia lanceoleosa]|uniref:Anthocyanidin 3-O-glucoside 2''-O-glucosyltransferase n=1 Tax=Camellia lanceoleosa TaxID=1840588 RepID=A0ACC0H651_9ERIC|nr:Anthocyanidin 3-O-glucoside 2''-O-glucosyltransferase [Camellia lanceoleosa]
MDNTQDDIENLLRTLKVDVVFFDFTHWMPGLARRLGIKSVHSCIISPATIGYTLTGKATSRRRINPRRPSATPAGYPLHSIKLNPHGSGLCCDRCYAICVGEHVSLGLPPNVGDQIINARMMSRNLKVGVEVEKGEDGLFTRESVCRAVRVVMDEESEIGKEVRENHGKMREFLLNKDLESSYIDDFNKKLHGLLG